MFLRLNVVDVAVVAEMKNERTKSYFDSPYLLFGRTAMRGTKRGYCSGFDFWFSPGGIANLLSIPQLEEEGHCIKYQTGGKMEVWTMNGCIITFQKSIQECARE
jgi:hypothetical protein